MKVRFACPDCDAANAAELPLNVVDPDASNTRSAAPTLATDDGDRGEATPSWHCGGCGKTSFLFVPRGTVDRCAVCGNAELYRRKDFPQWLGMGLLAVACGLFYVFAIRYQYAVAWAILLGSAAVDAAIYLIVGDVVVCYRCGCQHRGISSRAFDPHDLSTAEKYRQERLRKEEIKNRG